MSFPSTRRIASVQTRILVSSKTILLLSWLTLNRSDLTVFVHPNTGQDLEDHRDRAIWLGRHEPLVLDIFTRKKD